MSMRTAFDGDHLSRGINFMRVVSPGGQKVGDQKSGDQMNTRPNASQPTATVLGQLVLKKSFDVSRTAL